MYMYYTQARSQDCMEGLDLGVRGPGVEGAGAEPPAPKIFDIFTENWPFRDLRVHDIVDCLCKTDERQIKTIGHCEQKGL